MSFDAHDARFAGSPLDPVAHTCNVNLDDLWMSPRRDASGRRHVSLTFRFARNGVLTLRAVKLPGCFAN
jgi:hypothetical protein